MYAWKSVQEKIFLALCCSRFCFSRSQKPWRCVPRSNMVSVRPAFVKGFASLLTTPCAEHQLDSQAVSLSFGKLSDRIRPHLEKEVHCCQGLTFHL